MPIHNCTGPESVGSAVGGAIGGLGQAATTAWILSRQDTSRCDAEQAAAALGARAGVLRSTVHGLRTQVADERAAHREELLDLQADADHYRVENATLMARVTELEGAVRYLDALRKARAVT